MIPKRRITVFSHDAELAATLEIRLQSRGYQVLTQRKLPTLLGIIYSDPPDIIIIDISTPNNEIRNLVRNLKSDSYFSAIPVLGLISGTFADSFPWDEFQLDDFVFLPLKYSELFARITISLSRIQRVFDNNPLTRLPGNTSIQQAIAEAIGKPMVVCYIDINNFKPYNDIYGFTRGDEVLRMLARIMFNAVKESGGGFAGHIGGDDFVFILPMQRAEAVCTTIIDNFTAISLDLFEKSEKENGYYLGVNRKGQEERFPLLSIAIAVVPTDTPKIDHCGRVVEMAAELKNLAKKSGKSCFVVDKRKK
ncbi:MAG: diguanylate cyclase [Deltaproteobacteria bacterium]|nr:diguanylate cyclase [Deltaproteobacteria bacterium]